MENVVAFLQARMSSSRLPGKVLRTIKGKPMLELQIQRLRSSKHIDRLVVVTSSDCTDDQLEDFCTQQNISVFRGSLDDVLLRFKKASIKYPAKNYVRITGDCPLLDYRVVDDVINQHLERDVDYSSNINPPTYPDGMDVEIFKSHVLEKMHLCASSGPDREHVTLYARNNVEFSKYNLKLENDHSSMRITVDEETDIVVIESIVEYLGENASLKQIIELKRSSSHLFKHNLGTARNEGLLKSLREERMIKFGDRYKESMKFLDRALQSIPLGSQTFSKSKTQFPYGVSPYFIEKAKGSKTWDIDGNEYIDFLNALLCISLGHCDADVTKAVQEQLEKGTIFSLPGRLESEVAELLKEIIPCAESVRFGKNGSDVTSAAVRLARAYTGKDKIAMCGYHGWQDWYIGTTTKNLGVPETVSKLSEKFDYNNLDSLKKVLEESKGEFAAVIMEPMNTTYPKPGFLQEVKDLAHEHGALFIFDEMITGFRFSLGGASELFGVTPDLACFGKGMANGYPLSAVVGRTDIMDLMEDIFFSGTFGGEMLSLAAAKVTIQKLRDENVCEKNNQKGEILLKELQKLIKEHDLEDSFEVFGHPSWSFFAPKTDGPFDPWSVKTLFIQEMLSKGILTIGTHNISYAHSDSDIERLLGAYADFFKVYQEALSLKDIDKFICGTKLEPLFKVR